METTPDAETTSGDLVATVQLTMVEAAGARVGAGPRESVEIHAGVEYREYGLVEACALEDTTSSSLPKHGRSTLADEILLTDARLRTSEPNGGADTWPASPSSPKRVST